MNLNLVVLFCLVLAFGEFIFPEVYFMNMPISSVRVNLILGPWLLKCTMVFMQTALYIDFNSGLSIKHKLVSMLCPKSCAFLFWKVANP